MDEIRSRVIVESYSEEWPRIFERLEKVYRHRLGKWVTEIHHVGSTSVKGLAAKPIIDVDLVVESLSDVPPVIRELEKIGYTHIGDLGIKGREAFRCSTRFTPQDGSDREWLPHNLYLNVQHGVSLRNHLIVRDYLRSRPEKAKAYSELKKQLAEEFPYDRELYTEKKTGFIIEILRESGFDPEILQDIIEQNKAKK